MARYRYQSRYLLFLSGFLRWKGGMPRQVRIEFPGAVYHAMARGDRREDIVRADGDREAFVSLLGELVDRTGWEMFSWVLMSNHPAFA